MKKICMLSLLLLLSMTLGAQEADFQIKGRLIDASTRQPIDFADLFLFVTGETQPASCVFPNEKGEFVFSHIKKGTYTFMARLIGYDIFAKEQLIIDGKAPILLGDIPMKPLENGLAEVKVVADKRQLVYKLDKKIVQSSSNLLSNGGSAVDILETTPSIRIDAEGEVTFRGSSGFQVYVNGKPSVFTGTQALEQIPAGQVDNIEIITTPSAKHDSEGDVGIINIITKKHSLKGLSGMVNLSGSTWLSRKIDFLVTQQNRRSRWYLGGQWSDRLRKSHFDQEKQTTVNDLSITSHSVGPRKGNTYNYSLKGGWSLELPKTSFALDLQGGYGGHDRQGDVSYQETRVTPDHKETIAYYKSIDDYDNDENIGLGSFNVTHRFNEKGHELSGGAYYKYGGHALEYFFNDLNDLEGKRQQGHRAYESEHRETMRINVDYVLPIAKVGKLEAGYQYSSYLEDGDYKMEWWNPDTESFFWREDIYNTFYFREQLHSLYAMLSGSWNHFEAQAGIRGENTHNIVESSVEGADRSRGRFEVFPSAHIGYTFPKDHKLLFGYSYRTTRPKTWFMEPYITYRDFYTAEIGNVDILPEYINSFELNYRKIFGDNTVSATVFHRSRKDKIERLRVPYIAGVTLDSMANVGHDYSTGLELSVTLHPVRWWNTTVNGNVYHYKVKNEIETGGKNEASTNYDILWNNLITLGKYTRLQIDGSFVGPSVTTQGKTDAYWYANLAIRQQLFKRKLTATLAFRDVFKSANYVNNIQTARLISLTRIKPKYPQIMLTISYTFNSYKGKAKQEKVDRNEMFEGFKH